ncbi:MAG: NAD(P)H-binding protein [Devosiaceae bacterium]|nr:NAD(P)H-binding protein [Devosiaceae bacterium MH13]
MAAQKTVVLVGATGTIGRAVAAELVGSGHKAICIVRPGSPFKLGGARIAEADVTDAASLNAVFAGARADAVISCLASRTGAPDDVWAIDHRANSAVLDAAKRAGVPMMVLLSAICVQKPLLAFQEAKLSFEAELQASGLRYAIVRPTAFFKSLSGQIGRLRAGKPFLLFGDGALTACKPISDGDLARFIVGCLDEGAQMNAILPIGGPGPALTPREQGEALFAALGLEPKFKHVPVALLDGIIAALSVAGKLAPGLAKKAELARIGRYYATESMLVWDEARGRYDPDQTPEFGTDTLAEFYGQLARGDVQLDRREHAVF